MLGVAVVIIVVVVVVVVVFSLPSVSMPSVEISEETTLCVSFKRVWFYRQEFD